MRGLILAMQFLTRLPLPALAPQPDDGLARATPWFPAVGLLIGALVAALGAVGGRVDPWLGALVALLGWVWITGGLHLDGLADLADALGASHRDPARFVAILKDPHAGGFAVIVVGLQIAAKLVLLMLAVRAGLFAALLLVPAWARLGAVAWSQWLPPLTRGLGQAVAARSQVAAIAGWTLALAGASVVLAPLLVAAPLALLAWWQFLKVRAGGMNGDCLGAGIEVVESLLLFAVVVSASA